MSVNGITGSIDSYQSYAYSTKTAAQSQAGLEESVNDSSNSGVVYEPSLEIPTSTYKANAELIEKLKSDAEAQTEKLREIVAQLITKQGTAYANATDMWSFLREGNFTVDAATKAQAEEDISEDGYFGVKQTSDRIIDFALALTGGDTSKLEGMKEAFKKGYEQAEKTWGGELPEISQKTFDAVLEKFDKLMNEDAE